MADETVVQFQNAEEAGFWREVYRTVIELESLTSTMAAEEADLALAEFRKRNVRLA